MSLYPLSSVIEQIRFLNFITEVLLEESKVGTEALSCQKIFKKKSSALLSCKNRRSEEVLWTPLVPACDGPPRLRNQNLVCLLAELCGE